ncbi:MULTISPECIES: HAMP domain-containing protein [unclassified Exiguobacterium]|uniref:HAMP domain-containing protein n=1 Tax=unclassified Exiguobacterium TaxID=2644629 RepID=UPI0020370F9F|nr:MULTISPECIES: HAMP domain-containing protein [unclassified Exiguobacterium]
MIQSMYLRRLLIYFVLRLILRPLRVLTEEAERIKAGDLTEPITVSSNDEIGRVSESFNEMSDSLRMVLLHLDDSISQVAATASQIADIADENSNVSKQVAATTDDQLKSIEEVSQSAKSLATMAEELQELVSRFKL